MTCKRRVFRAHYASMPCPYVILIRLGIHYALTGILIPLAQFCFDPPSRYITLFLWFSKWHKCFTSWFIFISFLRPFLNIEVIWADLIQWVRWFFSFFFVVLIFLLLFTIFSMYTRCIFLSPTSAPTLKVSNYLS